MDPFDLAALFATRATLEGLDPEAAPRMTALTPVPDCTSVALLPGSFNPPTAAHLLLAERALRDGYDCVLFLYARRTAGKEPTGLIPEDRLEMLLATGAPAYGTAVCSHGLYAEQAEAAQRLFPRAEISFLLGSDKVLQVFDERWYEDRDGALERLFSRARLVVAPRSEQGDALQRCVNDLRNRRWSERITILRLHPAVSDLSSTHVRGLLRSGADPAGLVPPPVASYLAAVRAFAPAMTVGGETVDAYEMRARLVDVLWRINGELADAVDLRALTDLALSDTDEAARLRRALLVDGDAATQLVRAHAS